MKNLTAVTIVGLVLGIIFSFTVPVSAAPVTVHISGNVSSGTIGTYTLRADAMLLSPTSSLAGEGGIAFNGSPSSANNVLGVCSFEITGGFILLPPVGSVAELIGSVSTGTTCSIAGGTFVVVDGNPSTGAIAITFFTTTAELVFTGTGQVMINNFV